MQCCILGEQAEIWKYGDTTKGDQPDLPLNAICKHINSNNDTNDEFMAMSF